MLWTPPAVLLATGCQLQQLHSICEWYAGAAPAVCRCAAILHRSSAPNRSTLSLLLDAFLPSMQGWNAYVFDALPNIASCCLLTTVVVDPFACCAPPCWFISTSELLLGQVLRTSYPIICRWHLIETLTGSTAFPDPGVIPGDPATPPFVGAATSQRSFITAMHIYIQ